MYFGVPKLIELFFRGLLAACYRTGSETPNSWIYDKRVDDPSNATTAQ